MDTISRQDGCEDVGEGAELTFSWLHAKVAGYVAHSLTPRPSPWERYALWVALGAAGVGLLAAALSPQVLAPRPAAVALRACLVVELAAFAVYLGLMIARELPQFRKPRLTHAAEMDSDFAYWQGMVNELRLFPRRQREAKLRFASALRMRMNERMGLLYGGIQRLGIFPVLIALYLQFRTWKWGDWAAAFDVNLVAGLLIWMMVLLYAAGWLLIGLRTRLDTYVHLLESALQEEIEVAAGR